MYVAAGLRRLGVLPGRHKFILLGLILSFTLLADLLGPWLISQTRKFLDTYSTQKIQAPRCLSCGCEFHPPTLRLSALEETFGDFSGISPHELMA
jgi:hypothetical protein